MKKTSLAVAILFLIPLRVFCAAPSLYDAWDEFAEAKRRAENGGSFDGGEYAAALGDFAGQLDALMQGDRFKYIDSQRNNPQKTPVVFSRQNDSEKEKPDTMGELYGAVKNLRDTAESYRQQFSGGRLSADDAKILAERSFVALQSMVVTVARYETQATNATSSMFSLLVIIFSAVAAGIGAAIIVYVRRQKIVAELRQKMKDGQTIVRIQEDERNRMYRELHDTVAQDIRATSLFSRQLANLTGLPQDADAVAKKIMLLCQQSLNGIYATISGLAPPELNGNFSDALEMLCTNHQRLTGIPCKRHIGKEAAELLSALATDKKLNVYRIVQEALQNAAKHAHPSECSLIVNTTGAKVSLFVTDDGTGFSPDNANPRRTFGIFGMKSRAQLVGAQLSIDSSEEGGTEVKLEIPLNIINGGG
ncbi:MAG: sensor histidine kinase [Treponemataceae bacterium]|nr:sensor histidine kinase [Treponemataceae bacterium]